MSAAICLIFFLSGAPALLFETLWFATGVWPLLETETCGGLRGLSGRALLSGEAAP
jgi:hypothetical protein